MPPIKNVIQVVTPWAASPVVVSHSVPRMAPNTGHGYGR